MKLDWNNMENLKWIIDGTKSSYYDCVEAEMIKELITKKWRRFPSDFQRMSGQDQYNFVQTLGYTDYDSLLRHLLCMWDDAASVFYGLSRGSYPHFAQNEKELQKQAEEINCGYRYVTAKEFDATRHVLSTYAYSFLSDKLLESNWIAKTYWYYAVVKPFYNTQQTL